MEARRVEPHADEIRFGRGVFGPHRHVCAFFNGPDEEQRVLKPFIREGLVRGEKSLHIIDPQDREGYLGRLRASEIPVDDSMATGQLEVVSWDNAHVRNGRFDQYAMLSWADNALANNAAEYPRTRIVAHMEWALLDLPGVEDLLEYETRVNHMLSKHDAPVICAYDTTKFGANVAMDVMRTHPLVIIGGVLQENPFFVPPDELLLEIRESRSRRLPAGRTHSAAVSTA
jgi:hypothetical protein